MGGELSSWDSDAELPDNPAPRGVSVSGAAALGIGWASASALVLLLVLLNVGL